MEPVWPFHRPHRDYNDTDYDQKKDTEPEPQRRQKKARSRANLLILAQAGVDWDKSGDERTDKDYDNLDGFIVADNRQD